MPSRSLVALVVVLAAGVPTSALACDGGDYSVVGFVGNEQALLRYSWGSTVIGLFLTDFKSGKTSLYSTILKGDEPEADREKIRARRWHEAEAALKKRGLVLQQVTVENFSINLRDGYVLDSVSTPTDDGCYREELFKTRGKERITLNTTGYCGSSDTTSFGPTIYSPKNDFVVVLISSGCLGSGDLPKLITVVPVGPAPSQPAAK